MVRPARIVDETNSRRSQRKAFNCLEAVTRIDVSIAKRVIAYAYLIIGPGRDPLKAFVKFDGDRDVRTPTIDDNVVKRGETAK